MPVEVYAVRGDENLFTKFSDPKLTKDEYSKMSNDQFIIFAKVFLKDNIMDNKSHSVNSWQGALPLDTKIKMNEFFESIPDELIDLSTDITRRLLLKYITSNLRYGFGIDLNDDSRTEIMYMIYRLCEIDPRMIK